MCAQQRSGWCCRQPSPNIAFLAGPVTIVPAALLMDVATKTAAAATIIAALLGSVWRYLEWRAKLTPQVRRLMVKMREMLTRLIAEGGRISAAGTHDAQRLEWELEDLIDRLNDSKLRRCSGKVLEAWREVWFSTPPDPVEGPVPLAVEVWHALTTKEAIRVVLERVNTLERFLPPRG